MINIRTHLINDISSAITTSGILPAEESFPIPLRRSEDASHGDYASPVALAIGKRLKKNPLEVAQKIASNIQKTNYIEKVEVAAPGFLNITLSDTYLASRLDDLPQEELCGDACNVGNGKSINMEFISANPTGPLTLGNARTAFSVDALANVLSCAGYNVVREYYINDAGEQIARLGESVLRRILQEHGETVEFPEDLYQGEYILEIGRRIAEEYKEQEGKIFTKEDLVNKDLLQDVSTKAMLHCLDAIKKTIQDDLHITFDVWTSERSVRESGMIEKVLGALREKELLYTQDGAEFLKTTQFGDEKDRVMVKSNGSYAYITPDIAYHQGKFDREFDLIFTYIGADHQGHIPKLTAALQALGNDTSKLRMVAAQWLEIVRAGKQVALSKRKGNVYSLKDLIDEIGYDAARYFLISHALQTHMVLDLDVAKEKSEANPVYYVQYAYVRLESIIRKAKVEGILPSGDVTHEVSSSVKISHPSERALALELFAFPEVIEDIATSFSVHQLPGVAYNLARAVNAFYRDVPVLSESDELSKMSRLQIVIAAHTVLGKTMDLLGISKPDVM